MINHRSGCRRGWKTQKREAAALAAAILVGCCTSALAKKTPKADPLSRKTFDAPVEGVYRAALSVANHQWQLTSSDGITHTLTFQTTNTPVENSGGYSTYSVSVTCAPSDGGTAVSLQVSEYRPSQPSLMALMNRSERRKGMIEDFWNGMASALKESAPPQAPAGTSFSNPSPAASASAPPPQAAAVSPAPPTKDRAASTKSNSAATEAATPSEASAARPATAPAPSGQEASRDLAVVTFKSAPAGADITVEGKFFGDTPTSARLPGGDYTVLIEKAGYKPWKRTVTFTAGGTVTLDATLESSQ